MIKTKDNIVIVGFPGIGKSECEKRNPGKLFFDLESSEYHYDIHGDPLPTEEWVKKYVDLIKKIVNSEKNGKIILVSSHKEVRDELKRRKIPYIIVMPDRSDKNEYLKRYLARKSSMEFIQKLNNNWEKWIEELILDTAPIIFLSRYSYLSDIFE